MYPLKVLIPSLKFHAFGIMPEIHSKFFLNQLPLKGMVLVFHISEVTMLRMQDFEIRKFVVVWNYGCGPFLLLGCLTRALFSWLLSSSFLRGSWSRHICWAAGIGPDCVRTVWSYLCREERWHQLVLHLPIEQSVSVSLGLDSLRRKWVSVLEQCAIR